MKRERNAIIVQEFLQCGNMADIARRYNVSRENIRQVLARAHLTAKDAPPSAVPSTQSLAASRRKIASEERHQRQFGMSRADYESISPALKRAYQMQRGNAGARGIPFLLTFAEWLHVWVSSGKLEQRGLGKGRYHMSRPGDQGPYAVGNVKIIPHEDNSRECRSRDQRTVNPGVWFSKARKKYMAAYAGKYVGTSTDRNEAMRMAVAYAERVNGATDGRRA